MNGRIIHPGIHSFFKILQMTCLHKHAFSEKLNLSKIAHATNINMQVMSSHYSDSIN